MDAMKKKEDLIWDYLDGTCTPEERIMVDQKLANDPAFHQLFLQSQALHKNLQQIEVETPSMRFSQNVMDKLPPVRNGTVTPAEADTLSDLSPPIPVGFGGSDFV